MIVAFLMILSVFMLATMALGLTMVHLLVLKPTGEGPDGRRNRRSRAF